MSPLVAGIPFVTPSPDRVETASTAANGPSLWGRSVSSIPSRLRRKNVSIDAKLENGTPPAGYSGIGDERGRRRSESLLSGNQALTQIPVPSSSTSFRQPCPLDPDQASDINLGALGRGQAGPSSVQGPLPSTSRSSGLFGLKSSASGSMSQLCPPLSPEHLNSASSVAQSYEPVKVFNSGERKRRPSSPFLRARRLRDRARARDKSPDVGALPKDSAVESDGESVADPKRFQSQASAYSDGEDSGTEAEEVVDLDDDSGVEDDRVDGDEEEMMFDEETEKNTEANAVFCEGDAAGLGQSMTDVVIEDRHGDRDVLDRFGEEVEQDPMGEGPNVIEPPPSLFPLAQTNPHSQKSSKAGLNLVTSRPIYARDRCTITLTHGNPDGALEGNGKRMRRYVVLSDLSEESRYAVEWAIGTVARDGDEIFLISVKEDESKGKLI